MVDSNHLQSVCTPVVEEVPWMLWEGIPVSLPKEYLHDRVSHCMSKNPSMPHTAGSGTGTS
jgi:hypothetical protein